MDLEVWGLLNQSDLDADICDSDRLFDANVSGSTKDHCGELQSRKINEDEQ